MIKKITLTFCASFLLFNWVNAQETWSLEKCVQHARQNNITVQQQEINIKNNLLTQKANKLQRLPNLNGSISGGYQFGRTIDPVTNSFDNESIGANRISLSTGVTLFNGNRINNLIKQSKYDVEAAQADLEQTKNDISINVSMAYLNVLFAEEQLEAARNRKALSEEQLDQVDKLIRAGTRPENDRLDILAAIAQNEQQIILQENAAITNLLNLKQLLELDPGLNIQLEKPDRIVISDNEDPDAVSLEEVFQKSLSNQPFVRADQNRVKSAELGESIAQADLLPSLRASGSLSTNYSTRSKTLGAGGEVFLSDPDPVVIGGIPTTIQFEQFSPNLIDNPYFDQLNENFGQSVSLSINIPIYNNSQARIGMERARLNVLNSQLLSNQNLQNLKTNIQRAIADARAAKRQLQAAQSTQSATKAAFDNASKRFELGAINTFDYATAKNNYDQAEVDLIVAKYDYLFKLKIVDFYQGKAIKLN